MVWATIGDLVSRDPQEALRLVAESLEAGNARENIRKIALQAWGESDPDGALDWASSQDELSARGDTSAILSRLSLADPARALQLTIQSAHPSIKIDAARWAIMQWLSRDPEAAGTAYARLPLTYFDDEQMLRVSAMIAGELAQSKPDTALSLIEKLPQGQVRKQWLYGTAWTLASDDPARAAPLAETMPSGGSRSRLLNHIAKQWLGKDPASAGAWIEASGNFDTNARNQLLQN